MQTMQAICLNNNWEVRWKTNKVKLLIGRLDKLELILVITRTK